MADAPGLRTRSPSAPARVQRNLTRLTFGGGLQTDPDALSRRAVPRVRLRSRGELRHLGAARGGRRPRAGHEDPEPDTQPAWSPDGSTIVFRSERAGGGLFVVPALGGPAGSSPRSANVRHGRATEPKCCSRWACHQHRGGADLFYAVPAEGGSPRNWPLRCCNMARGNGLQNILTAGFRLPEPTTLGHAASTPSLVPASTWSSRTSRRVPAFLESNNLDRFRFTLEPHWYSALRGGDHRGHHQPLARGRRSSHARLAFGRTADDRLAAATSTPCSRRTRIGSPTCNRLFRCACGHFRLMPPKAD